MALSPDKLEKPFTKLRKLLKKLPKQPSPEHVHDLRTRTRRVEASLHALRLHRKRKGRDVLQAVTPIRKRAGKVRDMDVLTGFASTLSSASDNECRVQLLEHLGHRRFQDSRKLYKSTAKQLPTASLSLKRCASSIKRSLKGKRGQSAWPADAAAAALQLSDELANWPKLNKDNLHPFRLKVKELRYVLQLSGEDNELIDDLGKVKDKAGEWHDWTELATIAAEVLHHSGHCDLLEQIRSVAKQRFEEAIGLANRLRTQYFAQPQTKRSRGRRNYGPGTPTVKQPVLKATAALAA